MIGTESSVVKSWGKHSQHIDVRFQIHFYCVPDITLSNTNLNPCRPPDLKSTCNLKLPDVSIEHLPLSD